MPRCEYFMGDSLPSVSLRLHRPFLAVFLTHSWWRNGIFLYYNVTSSLIRSDFRVCFLWLAYFQTTDLQLHQCQEYWMAVVSHLFAKSNHKVCALAVSVPAKEPKELSGWNSAMYCACREFWDINSHSWMHIYRICVLYSYLSVCYCICQSNVDFQE
jgi:hypothetical protein